MPRPTVSIVLATFQRHHLLERSLRSYERQEFDNREMELVVIDDHSTDGTRELVMDWSRTTKIPCTVLTTAPKEVGWRDCGAVLNAGIRASSGRHILLTHPEVIPGRKSVSNCTIMLEEFEKTRAKGRLDFENPIRDEVLGPLPRDRGACPIGLYACCAVYYLSPREQGLLDTVDLDGKGALAVRDIEGFYELDTNGHPDYNHKATDSVGKPGSRVKCWESWVFGGCSRETWKRLGGMLETQQWGSVDVAFTHRRRTLGISNYTCNDERTLVIHQSHNCEGDTITPREEDAWRRELKGVDLNNPNKMVYPAVDFLGW